MSKFERKPALNGITYHIPSGCGTVHITVNFQDNKPVEVYATASAKGGCTSNIQAIGRLISIALQDGIETDRIIDQCSSVRCPTAMANKDKTHFVLDGKTLYVRSCADAVGKVIQMAIDCKKKKQEGA